MSTELEIRKEQRRWLFELLEVKEASNEDNQMLDRLLSRHKSGMLEEDVALVEKMISECLMLGAD